MQSLNDGILLYYPDDAPLLFHQRRRLNYGTINKIFVLIQSITLVYQRTAKRGTLVIMAENVNSPTAK